MTNQNIVRTSSLNSNFSLSTFTMILILNHNVQRVFHCFSLSTRRILVFLIDLGLLAACSQLLVGWLVKATLNIRRMLSRTTNIRLTVVMEKDGIRRNIRLLASVKNKKENTKTQAFKPKFSKERKAHRTGFHMKVTPKLSQHDLGGRQTA